MTAHITKDWWVCLCNAQGRVCHKQLGEFLFENQAEILEGEEDGGRRTEDGGRNIPVGLASTLEGSQEAGRRFKRRVREIRGRRTADGGQRTADGEQ